MVSITYKSETDIGGGVSGIDRQKENQDNYFNFEKDGIFVFCKN